MPLHTILLYHTNWSLNKMKPRNNCLELHWNLDFSNLLGKRKLVRKIEGGTKLRLIYEVLFYNNRGNKQKYLGILVKFLVFI